MWTLKIVNGAELAEKLVPEMGLPQPLRHFTIGRDPGNNWPIEDRTLAISGRHCEIIDTPPGPALRDLSTNGTFVNGASTRLMGEHLLRNGDRIELGPFTIGVSGPALPETPFAATSSSALAPTLAAAVSGSAAFDSAPTRGGDPAAMAALGSTPGAPGLTEILRVAAPAEDSNLDLTKIRLAPALALAPSAAGAAAAAAAVPPAAAAAPVVSAVALTQALARGLGLPVSALEGRDALLLVQQLALTARAATAAVRQLMEHQDRTHLSHGHLPSVSASLPEDNLLRVASGVDAAVLALRVAAADPVAVLQRSASELCAHEDRLLQALANACKHPQR